MKDLSKEQQQKLSNSIDNATSIEGIASFTLAFNEAALKAGQNNRDFLANMYGDPSHFIFELLQNAEDSNASKVSIILQEDKFIFIHNGKPFSIEDVIGICKVGNSSKDSTKIGKFGIGFKSVFAITNRPLIQSGPYCFELSDYNVPVVNNNIDKQISINNETKIILPFSSTLTPSSKNLIIERLKQIDEDGILFLSSIQKIDVTLHNKSYSIEKFNIKHIDSNEGISLDKIKILNTFSGEVNFLYSKKKIEINGVNKFVSIAFRSDYEDDTIHEQKQTRISVYFPTEVNSGLKFKINGPFETSPTRQQLMTNSATNQNVIDELLELYKKTLMTLKDNKFLDYKFMLQLPLKQDHINRPELYDQFYNANLSQFKTSDLLIAEDNHFHKPNEVFYSEEYLELNELFAKNELNGMFNQDVWFLEIPRSKEYKIIIEFLETIDVEFINFNHIYDTALFESIIQKKYTQELVKLYQLASKEKYINHIRISPKNIIRTSNKVFRAPFKTRINPNTEIKPIVFLPNNSNIESDSIVDSDLITQASSTFFKNLGLKEISHMELVEIDLLPKLNINDKELSIRTFLRIMDIYSNLPDKDKDKFISYLKDKEIVPVLIQGEFSLFTANKTVIKNDALNKIYANMKIAFLDATIQNAIFNDDLSIKNNNYNEFIERINVNDTMLIYSKSSTYFVDLDSRIVNLVEEKNKPKKVNDNGNTRHSVVDHFLEGSDSIIIDTEELSVLFWGQLCLLSSQYFEANYNIKFKNPGTNGKAIGKCNSSLIETLNEKKWIFTKSGVVSPREVTLEEFQRIFKHYKSDMESRLSFKSQTNDVNTSINNLSQMVSKLSGEQINEAMYKIQEIYEKNNKYSEYIVDIVRVIEKLSNIPVDAADKNLLKELKTFYENNLDLQKLLLILFNKYQVDKNIYNSEAKIKFKVSVILSKEFLDWKNNVESKWISSIFIELRDAKFRDNRQKFIEKMVSIKNYRIDESVINKNIDSINSLNDYLNFDHKIRFDKNISDINLGEVFSNNLTKLKKGLPHRGIQILDSYLEDDDYKSLVYFDNELDYLKELVKLDSKPTTPVKKIEIADNFKINYSKVDINKNSILSNQPRIPFFGTANQIRKKNTHQSYSGEYAEHIVYKHLKESKVNKLEWVSENAPKDIQSLGLAGLGYDFKYEVNGDTKYIEVKSFKQKSNFIKIIFTINELNFAIENGEKYSLFLCIKDYDAAIIHEISNPFSGINLPPPLLKDGVLIESSSYEISFEI
jgi:hypothetical protein